MALAQSSVEVYGTVNLSFGNIKYSNSPDGAPSLSKWDVANHASNYGFRGRESLGGGLTAWFQIEQNAPMERSNNTAITPASRNSAVGLQGAFGNVFWGQWTTPWADLDSLWGIGTVGGWGPVTSIIGRRETTGTAPNYGCANAGHGVATSCESVEAAGGVGHPFWRRASQSIHWQSPVWAGTQVKLMYQTNESKHRGTSITTTGANSFAGVTANPDLWSGSVAWSGMGGRARIGVAYDRHKEFTSTGTTDVGWRTTGGFNFGFMDVGFAYEQMKYKCNGGLTAASATQFAGTNGCGSAVGGDVKAKQWGVGVAVPVGGHMIRASYAQAKDLEGPNAAVVGPVNTTFATASATCPTVGTLGCGPTGAKTWNVGYEHRFSKRTQLGVGYAKMDNEANAAFTWTGVPGNQVNGQTAQLSPPNGTDISTFFVNLITRF
jgi:predicted porin